MEKESVVLAEKLDNPDFLKKAPSTVIENLRKGHQKKIVQLAQKEIQTGRNKVFSIGDFDRIVITAIDAKYREREKNGMMKNLNVGLKP